MDDVMTPMTSIDLHIPRGNDTIKLVVTVSNPPNPTKTPRTHGALLPPRYATISADKVSKGYDNVALDIPRGDGEKTLGEVEKAYILWRTCYIIILGASTPPRVDNRYEQKLTKYFFTNYLWAQLILTNSLYEQK
jgi:hypothetical protein